jgi:hypothetical protein
MDQIIMPSVNIQDIQWPLNLYTNRNPADGWEKPIAPGNPTANSPSVQQPQTVQNNLAMLIALNYMNWPFIWAAGEIGTNTINEQTLQIAEQDRNFTNEQALQIADQYRNFANETVGQMRTNQQYNQNGTMVFLNSELMGQISLLA